MAVKPAQVAGTAECQAANDVCMCSSVSGIAARGSRMRAVAAEAVGVTVGRVGITHAPCFHMCTGVCAAACLLAWLAARLYQLQPLHARRTLHSKVTANPCTPT